MNNPAPIAASVTNGGLSSLYTTNEATAAIPAVSNSSSPRLERIATTTWAARSNGSSVSHQRVTVRSRPVYRMNAKMAAPITPPTMGVIITLFSLHWGMGLNRLRYPCLNPACPTDINYTTPCGLSKTQRLIH